MRLPCRVPQGSGVWYLGLGFFFYVSLSPLSLFQFPPFLQSGHSSRTVPFLSLSTVATLFTKSYHSPDVAVNALPARTSSTPPRLERFTLSNAKGPHPCPPLLSPRYSETLSSRPEWPIFSLRSRCANVGQGAEGPWQHLKSTAITGTTSASLSKSRFQLSVLLASRLRLTAYGFRLPLTSFPATLTQNQGGTPQPSKESQNEFQSL